MPQGLVKGVKSVARQLSLKGRESIKMLYRPYKRRKMVA